MKIRLSKQDDHFVDQYGAEYIQYPSEHHFVNTTTLVVYYSSNPRTDTIIAKKLSSRKALPIVIRYSHYTYNKSLYTALQQIDFLNEKIYDLVGLTLSLSDKLDEKIK